MADWQIRRKALDLATPHLRSVQVSSTAIREVQTIRLFLHLPQCNQCQQIESHRAQHDELEPQSIQQRRKRRTQGAAEREGGDGRGVCQLAAEVVQRLLSPLTGFASFGNRKKVQRTRCKTPLQPIELCWFDIGDFV